MYRLWKW